MAGSNRPIRTAMIAMTTSRSISGEAARTPLPGRAGESHGANSSEMGFEKLPGHVADLRPRTWSKRLGDTLMGRDAVCPGKSGKDALAVRALRCRQPAGFA